MTRPLKPCGTRAAYKRHIRNREVPCAACAEAIALYHGSAQMAAVIAARRAVLDEVAAQTIWHGRRSA